jgi:hypothetical protein
MNYNDFYMEPAAWVGKVTDMQIADPQNQEKLKPGVDVIIL